MDAVAVASPASDAAELLPPCQGGRCVPSRSGGMPSCCHWKLWDSARTTGLAGSLAEKVIWSGVLTFPYLQSCVRQQNYLAFNLNILF